MALLDSTTPPSDPAADFLARDNEVLTSVLGADGLGTCFD